MTNTCSTQVTPGTPPRTQAGRVDSDTNAVPNDPPSPTTSETLIDDNWGEVVTLKIDVEHLEQRYPAARKRVREVRLNSRVFFDSWDP